MVKNNKQQLSTNVQVLSGLNIAGILALSFLAYLGTLWSLYATYAAIADWSSIKNDIFGVVGELLFVGLNGLVIGLTIACATISISLSRGRYRLNNQLLKVAIVIETLIAALLLIRLFTI